MKSKEEKFTSSIADAVTLSNACMMGDGNADK